MKVYSDLNVLVTGASGFIGSHLVEELLKQGANVTALVKYNSRNECGYLDALPEALKSRCNIVLGDIMDSFMMNKIMPGHNMVMHLAALIGIPYSYIAPHSYLRTNIEGTLNLLEAAKNAGVSRFIHTSTSETYGSAIYTPIDEKHPMQGQSPYSASKIAADKIAESYYCSFNFPVVTIRPFNTFGPRQSARAVIPTIITQLLNRVDKLRIGSLSPVRDMTYVTDTVAGFLAAGLASESCFGEVINLGVGQGYTIEEIAKMLMDIIGYHPEIIEDEKRIRPENSEVKKLISNNTKAKELLGWEPKVIFSDGLRKTVSYMEKHLQQYNPNQYVT